jgi:hypothetical protein
VDFLRQHVLLPGRPPAVLVPHSIGCFMTLRALGRIEGAAGGGGGGGGGEVPPVVQVGVGGGMKGRRSAWSAAIAVLQCCV